MTRDDGGGEGASKTFFETLRGAVLTSIPALSALVFVVVAVKVFRASMMEITTTVAIVSTADVVALLKGVVLTLLPGFLAGLTAVAIWWWAGVLPQDVDDGEGAARSALLSPQAVFAWAMLVVAFFTVWWPVFLLLLAPVLAATAALAPQSLGRSRTIPRAVAIIVAAAIVVALLVATPFGLSWPAFIVLAVPAVIAAEGVLFGLSPPRGRPIPLRWSLKGFGLFAAAFFTGFLALKPSVWLPLRSITVTGNRLSVGNTTLPATFSAFVLSRDSKGASLLLNDPRAVLEVGPNAIAKEMPFCVPPPSKGRVLTIRASQVLGIDPDPGTPYEICRDLRRRRLLGP